MSAKGAPCGPIRQLKNLLRCMLRDQACLVLEPEAVEGALVYSIYINVDGEPKVTSQPDGKLVEQVLKQDLLTKTTRGWVIGRNGRLALRRLLAGADPFAEQHQERKIRTHKTARDTSAVLVNDRSSPLGWLSRRKDRSGTPMISKLQFAAGERLAQDFQFSGMMPRMTSSWSGPGIGRQRRSAPGAGIEISDNRLAARQRVRAAVEEVGSDLSDIMLDICCFQMGLCDAEKTRGWPRRSGKLILQIALDRLATHYGMGPSKQAPQSRSSISHWGGEGYKPS